MSQQLAGPGAALGYRPTTREDLMKRSIALLGLVCLVGCFLPLVPGLSLFDMRHFDALQVYLMIGAFVVPMVIGFGSDRLSAGTSLVAMGCFGFILYKFGF